MILKTVEWGRVFSHQIYVVGWNVTFLFSFDVTSVPPIPVCIVDHNHQLILLEAQIVLSTAWSDVCVWIGGVDINLLWKCQSDISPDRAQSQINLITKRKSSWDLIIYSRANPTFPIVKYRSFLFLFLLPIHYNVNKGCGTTVNDMVLPLFPFTCVYILLLCTLWPYVRLAFPKFVVTDLPTHRL